MIGKQVFHIKRIALAVILILGISVLFSYPVNAETTGNEIEVTMICQFGIKISTFESSSWIGNQYGSLIQSDGDYRAVTIKNHTKVNTDSLTYDFKLSMKETLNDIIMCSYPNSNYEILDDGRWLIIGITVDQMNEMDELFGFDLKTQASMQNVQYGVAALSDENRKVMLCIMNSINFDATMNLLHTAYGACGKLDKITMNERYVEYENTRKIAWDIQQNYLSYSNAELSEKYSLLSDISQKNVNRRIQIEPIFTEFYNSVSQSRQVMPAIAIDPITNQMEDSKETFDKFNSLGDELIRTKMSTLQFEQQQRSANMQINIAWLGLFITVILGFAEIDNIRSNFTKVWKWIENKASKLSVNETRNKNDIKPETPSLKSNEDNKPKWGNKDFVKHS
jgi:hypothetical protein